MKVLDQFSPLTDFEKGLVQGIMMYAWWKDGVQYVGTTGKTLERAIYDALTDYRNQPHPGFG